MEGHVPAASARHKLDLDRYNKLTDHGFVIDVRGPGYTLIRGNFAALFHSFDDAMEAAEMLLSESDSLPKN